MLGHRHLSASEYLEIWRRRRKWALVCLLLGVAGGYALSRTLPAKYTSTAVIEWTRNLQPGGGTVKAEAVSASQLSVLEGQVLTLDRLQALRGLVERVAYHSPDTSRDSADDPLAEIRRNIVLKPAAGGFTVSFTARDPQAAKEACATIVRMFMEASATEQPQLTDKFLNDQIADAKRRLDAQEAKLAAFQRRHGVQPPADEAETQNSLMGYNVQLEAANGALNRALQERTSLTESIRTIESAASQARPVAERPNVLALEHELDTEQAQLVTLEARYTPDHPDVVKLRTDIAQIQRKIDEARKAAAAPKKPDAAPAAEPPQVAQMRARVQELDRTVQEKTAEQIRLQAEIQAARARLENGAALQQEYKQLTLDREAARTNYNDLLAKQSEMVKAMQIERSRSAFRLVEAANLPAAPSFPDPILFTLGGAGGGFGVGLLVVVLGEWRDKTLRTEGDIEHYLELPTLAVIPAADAPDRKDSAGRGGSRAARGEHGEKEESVLADV